MMRLSMLRKGYTTLSRPAVNNNKVKLSTVMASRTIIHLPNLPDDEHINWRKEIVVGFVKFLTLCTVYTAATNYLFNGDEANTSSKPAVTTN
mmetsp:Transcript_2604/g.4742  ORF Transcript_2604/g.4742 Transcript_2604/m.4742 type:complete len:92 (-) Transcript_2604:1486-1761(-)